jgi:hypothetical protein
MDNLQPVDHLEPGLIRGHGGVKNLPSSWCLCVKSPETVNVEETSADSLRLRWDVIESVEGEVWESTIRRWRGVQIIVTIGARRGDIGDLEIEA